jgi:hypothetical protein
MRNTWSYRLHHKKLHAAFIPKPWRAALEVAVEERLNAPAQASIGSL